VENPVSDSKRKLLETAMEMIWRRSYGSVSVEDICTESGVNKGSFYHAFKSKSDLAVSAFEHYWEQRRPLLDAIFSPQVPPLERLDKFCQLLIKEQKEKCQRTGKLQGCPCCSLGSELGTQNEKIRLKMEQICMRQIKYLESVVRDLAAAGLIEIKDEPELAREIYSYINGVLMQAKIENNPKSLDRLHHGVIRLLNLKQVTAAV
jgi:TetR/AcrR family transcriptional regulator, transcriptional repressor for nem operon